MKNFPIADLPFFRLLLLLCCLAGGTALSAQSLSIQGIIKKADGTALADGDYDLTFAFYDASSGGTKENEVTVSNVEVTGGVYSVVLSGLNLPFTEDYFVSVKVGSGQEMTPRIPLTSAPYALALRGTANLFGSTGNVGIGTVTPTEKLHIRETTANASAKILLEGTSGGTTELNFKKTGFSGSGSLGYNISGNNALRLLSSGGDMQLQATGTGASITLTPNNTGLAIVDGSLLVNRNVNARGGAPGASGSSLNGYAFAGNGGDNDSGLYSTGDGIVSLYSNNTERLKVLGDAVTVTGGVFARGGLPGGQSNGYAFAGNNGDGDSGMYSDGDGILKLFVNGNEGLVLDPGSTYIKQVPIGTGNILSITSDGRLVKASSSARYKQNIQPLVADFKRILSIEPKSYRYLNSPEKVDIGFIAEELDSLDLQHFVVYDNQGRPDGVSYDRLVVYMVPLMREQQQRLDALEADKARAAATLSALQAENAALRQTLSELRADVTALKASANR